jgi:hypothetical protein
MSLTTSEPYVQNAIDNATEAGGNTDLMPIPSKTARVLHPALKQLSEKLDLIAYADVVGRKTKYGERPGPNDWHYTRAFVEKYSPCTPDDVIALFREAGADNDVEAMFHVVNSQHLIS